jgi:16S rRNA (cytosine967-C5)-methyltransferase
MLDAAAILLPVGGLLVYSTCALEREENEEQVDTFLKRHSGFRVEATEAASERFLDARGCLWVRPQDSGFDGAFAARMRRIA